MSLTTSRKANRNEQASSPVREDKPGAGLPTLRPPLHLVLGPAGTGKTETAFTHFLSNERRSLLIVPSPQQAENYAERLSDRSGMPVGELQGRITTFHGLIADINALEFNNDYRSIGRAFQRIALSSLLPETLRADDFLGKMREAPGFVTALAERIREWKLACITPELLEAGAQPHGEHDPGFVRKVQELARLFRAYEMFLRQNRLRDEADVLRLATEQVREARGPLPGNVESVLVDGFYRFNRAQRELLAALAARGLAGGKPEVDVCITLPYEAERPLLFAAPARTLQRLREEFATHEQTLARRSGAFTPLALLEQRLFATTGQSPPVEVFSTPVSLFDAPNPYVEAEMVAREFRRIHAGGGIAWSDFGVILRTLGDYAPILSAVFERYQIPLGVDGPELLVDNPLIKTVLHLLAVFRSGWQRDDVLAVLKSGYTAPERLAADRLRRRARALGIRAGMTRWMELNQSEADTVLGGVLREMARFDALFNAQRSTLDVFVGLIRELIGAFGLEERISLGEPGRQERDRSALKEALNILEALAEMGGLARRGLLGFATFHEELLVAWQNASAVAPTAGDVVRVAEPYDSRERPLRVAAVMGLTERVFPRRVTEDPFLRDDEREVLRAAGLDLEAQKARTDDERLFFYLAITAASEGLLLSYPRASDESDTLPSFYLDEVRTVLPSVPSGAETSGKTRWEREVPGGTEDPWSTHRSEPGETVKLPSPSLATAEGTALRIVVRTLADVAPRPEEVVSASDRVVAACADLFDPGSEADPLQRQRRMRQAGLLMQQCLETEPSRTQVRAVVASRRLPHLPRLESPELQADFAGRERVFSVSELETYRRCPFQYLLRHTFHLYAEAEDTDPRAHGTILHSVLRRYFRRKASAPTPAPDPENALDTMRSELKSLLAETLETERLDASPHRLRMTQRLLADALDRFAERELRFTPQFGVRPTYMELSFGITDAAMLEDDDRWGGEAEEAAIHDPASCLEPLRIVAQDGGSSVAICGSLDRVDIDPTGRRALVMDYKMGKPPEYAEIQRGSSLQMPLYLLALERLFGLQGAVACYDSMQERGRRRLQRLEHINLRQFGPLLPLDDARTVTPLNRDQFAELVRTTETAAVQSARAIASGKVEATPGEHCRNCAYGDVCRTTLTGGHDGEFVPLSALGTSFDNASKQNGPAGR